MQLVINEKNKVRLNRFLDWILYMVGYTIVFFLVTCLFKSFHIDGDYIVLWYFIIELIIYLLNKTVRPILFTLTIPITGLTLGLFYPVINVIILKMADYLLGDHFNIDHLLSAFFAAILISIMNFIMEEIIKNIIRKVKKNG